MNSLNGQASKQTLTEALRALRARGVGEHVFADFRAIDPEVILDTCRWFDEQDGRVGVGVLVEELRGGGRKPARRQSVVGRRREYAAQLADWLGANVPEVCGPARGPHPAAVAELIRLHHRHGRHAVTAAGHGARIRAAVARFEEEHGGA